MTRLLRCVDVFKQFGGLRALDGVSMTADAGEIVGIIGPNGSGKSTLLNVLTGFIRPDSGSVRWDGADITRARAHRRARMGLVRTFQEDTVFTRVSVEESLSYGMRSRRGGISRAHSLAERVGMPRQTWRLPAGMLSWGQGRLLGMGMALSSDPRILLLDEPFAGLNRQYAEETTTLLRRLRGDGMGLVIVEHEMSLLLPLCDRLIAMADGSVLAMGDVDDVISSPDVQRAYFGNVVGHA